MAPPAPMPYVEEIMNWQSQGWRIPNEISFREILIRKRAAKNLLQKSLRVVRKYESQWIHGKIKT